jgi:hypothetical protein
VLTTRRPWHILWPLMAAGLLALVLLLSQTLGLLHGIAHGPSLAGGAPATVARATQSVEHEGSGFLKHLFSGHGSDEGDPACRLYDQSSHFDTVPGLPVLVLPLVLAPFVFSVLPGLAVARWHALFQARGPPLVR